MLTDVIQIRVTVRVRPQPTLGPVVPCTVLISSRYVPERHGYILAVDPFPVGSFLWISNCAHPVLAICIAPKKWKITLIDLLLNITLCTPA